MKRLALSSVAYESRCTADQFEGFTRTWLVTEVNKTNCDAIVWGLGMDSFWCWGCKRFHFEWPGWSVVGVRVSWLANWLAQCYMLLRVALWCIVVHTGLLYNSDRCPQEESMPCVPKMELHILATKFPTAVIGPLFCSVFPCKPFRFICFCCGTNFDRIEFEVNKYVHFYDSKSQPFKDSQMATILWKEIVHEEVKELPLWYFW